MIYKLLIKYRNTFKDDMTEDEITSCEPVTEKEMESDSWFKSALPLGVTSSYYNYKACGLGYKLMEDRENHKTYINLAKYNKSACEDMYGLNAIKLYQKVRQIHLKKIKEYIEKL